MSQQNVSSESRVSQLASRTGTLLVTGLFTRNRLWVLPVVAAVTIVGVGWWTNRSVRNAIETGLAGQLQTLLDADIAALDLWIQAQQADVTMLGRDTRISEGTAQLVALANDTKGESVAGALLTSSAQQELRSLLNPWCELHDAIGFVIVDPQMRVVAGDQDAGVGDRSVGQVFTTIMQPVFAGDTILIPPFKSLMALPDDKGVPRAGLPVMFVATPICDENKRLLAALCVRIRPEGEFTEILGLARAGKSGETYAFNRDGVMITNSRFDNELKRIGLLADDNQTRSLLNVDIRDPGVDMTQGQRPTARRPDQPLTRMAAEAIAGKSGIDVDGYSDYRGVSVVGAWRWLPQYHIGVATEVDVAEALQPLHSLQWAFAILTGLLCVVTVVLSGLTFYTARLERQARHAVLDAKRLGQYSLDEELGAGGMGVVYRAHHDMLHRPTAVKLLNVDKSNAQAITRFEREVQLTSQLTHPNTIAIYDYGRTPEGVFYYAMEYLDGMTLEGVVNRFGALPANRTAFILQQLCGSLAEAHDMGLIHRDVKPANIMLTRQGGMYDFVKLLDFGLVKPEGEGHNVTQAGALTGTPLYLSPEAIQHQDVDARSDLYAVGAVAYFMLTGQPVFRGKSIVETCNLHVSAPPQVPSERLGKKVNADLEQLILRCLAKVPDDRPASAHELGEALETLTTVVPWTRSEAREWWHQFMPEHKTDHDTASLAANLTATMIRPTE